jgi:chlorobactene glucosyltransferase
MDFNPFISILIPARNEEKNISACLQSVLNQSYNNYEVVVLNDNSTDKTKSIVEELIKLHPNLKLVEGENLPSQWLGKNWACHQLSQTAKGDYFLFIDADVELCPKAVESSIQMINKNNLKMFSVFPTQKTTSFGVQFIVPLMNWLLLSFLPLKKVFSSNNPSFVAANGQFILFEKSIYFKLGGHARVKNEVVEDMELARLAKQNKYQLMTALGGNLISCKMYNELGSAVQGFTKNFYPGFKINPFLFIIFISLLLVLFFFPFVIVIYSPEYLVVIVLILISRIIVSYLSRQSVIINFVLHPFQMLTMWVVGINSVIQSKRKNVEWKGRRL